MSRSFKRPRTQGAFSVPGAKRPIDKSLVVVNKNVSTTQLSLDLISATFPCTITGIRWSLSTVNLAVSSTNIVNWAIVLVKDGNAANAIATSDGASFYQPEQNVLAFGTDILPNTSNTAGALARDWVGNTKTMRKLMAGDKIQLICLAGISSAPLYGVVQFFCKT